MAKLDQILQQVRTELGTDFIATDVVGMDGLSIASASADPNFDTSAASARFAMVTKLASRVSEKLGLGAVEDNLATTEKMYIISRLLGNNTYYWSLAVPRDSTLGTVRMLMNEYADQVWDAIPR